MKKVEQKLPKDVINQIVSDHQRALLKIKKKQVSTIIPIHTAPMSVITENGEQIVKTIIPPLAVYIEGTIVDGKINSRGIRYTTITNNKPLPLAHIYSSSGYLCLGSIFVPQLIPYHSPQQPLETLFLHNDRYVSHGNPQLSPNANKHAIIEMVNQWLPNHQLPLNDDWIRNDIIWRIGAKLLEAYEKKEAFTKMTEIFNELFK